MFLSLWVGVGLSSLDASIVATIYPQIGTEFKRYEDYLVSESSVVIYL